VKPEETRAAKFLREIGLRVEPVATSEARTCDFRVRDDVHSYLVEVKLKNSPNMDAWQDYEPHSRPVGLDQKGTQRKLHDAASQLRSTRTSATEFAVPWIAIPRVSDENILLTQTVDTFFGVQRVGEPPYRTWKRCYFFGESTCFRHPEIDGLLVDAKKAVRLCVNTLSPRVAEFRETALFRFFAARDWTIDPVEEDRAGVSLVADCAIPRTDERSVLEYVKAKYDLGLGAVNIVMREHSAIARIPTSELDE
jgi:hypothetical protein